MVSRSSAASLAFPRPRTTSAWSSSVAPGNPSSSPLNNVAFLVYFPTWPTFLLRLSLYFVSLFRALYPETFFSTDILIAGNSPSLFPLARQHSHVISSELPVPSFLMMSFSAITKMKTPVVRVWVRVLFQLSLGISIQLLVLVIVACDCHYPYLQCLVFESINAATYIGSKGFSWTMNSMYKRLWCLYVFSLILPIAFCLSLWNWIYLWFAITFMNNF